MEVISNLVEAHIFRFNDSKMEFLLLKRSEKEELYPCIWQAVTGTIKADEKAYDTALREIHEETGLTPSKFWVVPNVNSFYTQINDRICMVPVFACLVESKSDVIISDEHSEYKWVNKEEADDLLYVEGHKKSLEIIYKHFSNEKSFLNFVDISDKIIKQGV